MTWKFIQSVFLRFLGAKSVDKLIVRKFALLTNNFAKICLFSENFGTFFEPAEELMKEYLVETKNKIDLVWCKKKMCVKIYLDDLEVFVVYFIRSLKLLNSYS